MSTIKAKNIKQTVIGGTTQPLKIGGVLDDGSDAKITIDTSGNLTASNLTATLNGLLTTNGQIKFPATQNPSADANTLDDYEEGTWTPADAFGQVAYTSNNTAYYVKIGRLVICTFDIIIASNTNSNYFRMTKPFASTIGHQGSGVVSYNNHATGITVNNFEFWLAASIYLYSQVSGKRFAGTITYIADQ